MKNLRPIFFFCFIAVFAIASFAQSKHFALQSLQFNKKINEETVSSSCKNKAASATFLPGSEPPINLHMEPFHYTAFFCKMELKTVNRLGVWIKVHAGDYDAYGSEKPNR